MTKDSTPSAKEQVLAWVRSKNPSTMELKFGCRIVLREESKYANATVGQEYVFCADMYPKNEANKHMGFDESRYEIVDIGALTAFEILGSDMGLQELLIAFNSIEMYFRITDSKIHKETVCFFTSNPDVGDYETTLKNFRFRFDLTKNLHFQSEDFYNAILPLIK